MNKIKKKNNKYFKYFEKGLTNKEISKLEKVDKSTVSKARKDFKNYKGKVDNQTEEKVTAVLVQELNYFDKLREEDFNNLEDYDIQRKFVYLKLKQMNSLTKLKINLNESLNILIGTPEFRSLIIKETLFKDKGEELSENEKIKLRELKSEQALITKIINDNKILVELFKNINLPIGDS